MEGKVRKEKCYLKGIFSSEGCTTNCIRLRINAGNKDATNAKDKAIADVYSSNVLHSRALLQKSATGCLVHHYSYPSAQFVENYTLDQIDGKLYFGSNLWKTIL